MATSSLPDIVVKIDTSAVKEVQTLLSSLQPVQIAIDADEFMSMVGQLKNANITIDASSINDQLSALQPFIIGVDRSEIDKMASLLSSIRVSLDVSALENAVSQMKVGVDTTQLESSITDLRSMDMGSISSSLASIEATIRKVSEDRMTGVKVTSEDIGSSSNKLQMEMMMRLAEAIDRLNTSTSKEQGDRRIVVELEMDGRQLKTKILKDTSILT